MRNQKMDERFGNSHFNSYKLYKALLKMWRKSTCKDKDMMIQELENAIRAIEEQASEDLAAQDAWEYIAS